MPLPKVETPTYKLTVPSSGETVTYRPYLVKEEKILMLGLESDDNNEMIHAVKQVIESCTDGQLNDSNMTMFDLEYFFTNLRSKSVGETSEVSISCPQCEERSIVQLDLSDVSVNVEKDPNHYIKSISDTIKVRMKYPTVSETMRLIEKYSNDVDLAYDLVLISIAEIYHGDEIYDAREHSRNELTEFVESLSTAQFLEMKEFVENSPTAKLTYHHHCTSCGYKNDETLDGLANFFE